MEQQNILNVKQAFAGFSVDDTEKAKEFYHDILGVDVSEEEQNTLSLNFNDQSCVMIYPKDDHQPASFTVLNFPVDDIEKTVTELKQKGVKFEQYTGEIKTDEDDIHREDGMSIAWFKDPAGNILSVVEEEEESEQ